MLSGDENIHYLSAIEEGKYVIAQANADMDENGKLIGELVSARENGEFIMASPDRIQYMDVAPRRSFPWLPRSFRSWNTTTPTAL